MFNLIATAFQAASTTQLTTLYFRYGLGGDLILIFRFADNTNKPD